MGFWGCRSFDNDAVHDHLSWAGRKGGQGFDDRGGLTEGQLERYLINRIQPLLMSAKEKEVQTALGSMPILGRAYIFLGLVIWGLRQGFHFQPLVLDAALAAGYTLLRDKEDLQQWKHPKARGKRIGAEICMLINERLGSNRRDYWGFIQNVSRKFPWAVGRGR